MKLQKSQNTNAVYRDISKTVDERVSDLVSRMTLPEKAGQLFHNMLVPGPEGSLAPRNPTFGIEDTKYLISTKLMTHFNLLGPVSDPSMVATWQNAMQEFALSQTRLGIPITFSTDPRNHFTENVGTSFQAGNMSLWPETLGFAALRDPKLVERFADIARQEYLALGLRTSLHPQVDLATEYRWARINATFGEDADLSEELVQAYILGFQKDKEAGLGPQSVSTMTKHFPGGGPQMNGEDSHFSYGREQCYPGNCEGYHLRPFEKAIEAGTRQIMPYYGMPVGTDWEEVGFAFNKSVITGVLREKLGFNGIICTDWGLITDTTILGQDMPARAWGCESLSELERVKKILDAGCDQFGGESRPELVIQLVRDGLIPESRIDISVARIMREKFTLGLFDNPFVDVKAAAKIVGQPQWKAEGEAAQRRAHTLLKNEGNVLPLRDYQNKTFYMEGVSQAAAQARGLKLGSFEEADIAIVRLRCPYETRTGGFEAHFHAGSLEYSTEEQARQKMIFSKSTISIVDIYLDRPAVIPEVASQVTALTASFGSNENAYLDVIFGTNGAAPEGKLPFDLPSSMNAVRKSREDVPFDTESPLFKFGYGLSYEGTCVL